MLIKDSTLLLTFGPLCLLGITHCEITRSDLGQREGFPYAPEYFLHIHWNLDSGPCRHVQLF